MVRVSLPHIAEKPVPAATQQPFQFGSCGAMTGEVFGGDFQVEQRALREQLLGRAQSRELHALDVNLDEVHAAPALRNVQFVDADGWRSLFRRGI